MNLWWIFFRTRVHPDVAGKVWLVYCRFDLGRPTRAFALRACTLQNGAVAVVFYVIALVASLSVAHVDDKIHLWRSRDYAELWSGNEVSCL